MPLRLDSYSNTFMQLNVRDNVLQQRPVVQLDFPAEAPDAFGLLQSDAHGGMTWLGNGEKLTRFDCRVEGTPAESGTEKGEGPGV